jgi:putative PIN family toxin of toxin-antitoxin system
MQVLVLDTNIVLDLFVFRDAAAAPLATELAQGGVQWLATAAMREELQRVLDYPQIARSRAFHGIDAAEVLARFDAHARLVDEAQRAPVRCADEDDQKFIDLAVTHRAILVSKDGEVLKMKNRLLQLGCPAVRPRYEPLPA